MDQGFSKGYIGRGGNFLSQTFVVVHTGILVQTFSVTSTAVRILSDIFNFSKLRPKKRSQPTTTLSPLPPCFHLRLNFLLDIGDSLLKLQNLERGASASPSISLCINYSLLIHHYTLIIPCVQCRFDCTMKIATRPTIALHSLLSSLLTGRRCDTFY